VVVGLHGPDEFSHVPDLFSVLVPARVAPHPLHRHRSAHRPFRGVFSRPFDGSRRPVPHAATAPADAAVPVFFLVPFHPCSPTRVAARRRFLSLLSLLLDHCLPDARTPGSAAGKPCLSCCCWCCSVPPLLTRFWTDPLTQDISQCRGRGRGVTGRSAARVVTPLPRDLAWRAKNRGHRAAPPLDLGPGSHGIQGVIQGFGHREHLAQRDRQPPTTGMRRHLDGRPGHRARQPVAA